MPSEEREDTTIYKVVVNDEEQYSIWPAERENAPGWRDFGKSGRKQDCLDHIETIWTDMRPLSLRKKMEQAERERAVHPEAGQRAPVIAEGPTLVERLCSGSHPVEASLRPMRTVAMLQERIALGRVLVRFTGTKGTTELGFRLDTNRSDWSQADFEKQHGSVRLVGDLKLDGVDVRCVADIDLATLAGSGHLERI